MKSTYQNALELFQEKKYQEAENILIKLHEEIPNDPEVAYFLAVLKSKSGKYEEAVGLFKNVIDLNKENTEAYYNLALVYQNLNQLNEALVYYEKALEKCPFLSEAHNNIAIIYRQLGNSEAAEKAFLQAIKTKPNNQNAMSNLGSLVGSQNGSKEFQKALDYYNSKELDKALKALNKLYVENNKNLDVLNLMGMVHYAMNSYDESIRCYENILSINENSDVGHYSLGVCYQGKENNDLALHHYKKAIEINPRYLDALNNLGLLYVSLKNFEEAEKCYCSALEYDPCYFNSITNLGALKVNTDKVQEGIEIFDRALSLAIERDDKAQSAVAYGNIGFAKLRQLDLYNAIKYFRMALEFDNNSLLAHYNLGEALLMTGQFEEGWKEYEYRTGRKDFGLRHFNKPVTGQTNIKGKRVLVYAEQGIGDAIQFVRYLPLLKEKGPYIIFECDKSLFGLMKSVSGIDEIIERNLVSAPEIEYDYDIPLLSLPMFFNTTLDNVPSEVPYLKPEDEYLHKWKKIIGNSDNLKVGIVWAGSPTHSNDRHRSVRLKKFLNLMSIEDTEFYSLQKGFPTIQARDYQLIVRNMDEHINTFSDTAAAISYLDLVITVDTSVAHMAGALGKPVWVLLPYAPDWRWMLDRTDSPWYPTMKLYRQPKLWDWDSVFNQLKADIISLIKKKKSTMSMSNRSYSSLDKFLSKIESETYPEAPSEVHSDITKKMLSGLFPRLSLQANAQILDIGCGQGPALEIFKKNGFNPIGITLNDEDVKICRDKGFNVLKMDQSFLDFESNRFDFLWSRHCLEHSFAPYYTLSEYFRVAKPGGYIYIEVPAPDTVAHHETNLNHYSVLSRSMWTSLLQRSGFVILDVVSITPQLVQGTDEYWGFICQKPEINSADDNKKQTLYLALTSGENFGWGICSKYLRKELSSKIDIVNVDDQLTEDNSEIIRGTILHALTNHNFYPLSSIRGKRNFGYTFFESELTDISIENAKKYEKVIGGSSWNLEKMLQKGITNADYLIQGIDPEMFYPGEINKNSDLFVIFSGGKFELRKGQDLVLKAVQILQQKYSDVILINSWYNLWPETMDTMAASKFINYERKGENWQQFMVNLLKINNIDGNKVFTLPLTPNDKMREVYLKSDIGLFPNRCEGGTNLVLMEYMACGKPVIASFNSGHKDIITEENSFPIKKMNNLKLFDNGNSLVADWEEPELDEIVALLEFAYFNRSKLKEIGKKAGEDMKKFTWSHSAECLLKIISKY